MKREAMFYKKLEDGSVRCRLCPHHCKIENGETGFSKVRENENGMLVTDAYGETIARDKALLARERGIKNVFVTNGFMARRTLSLILCSEGRHDLGSTSDTSFQSSSVSP
jgi:pyruvate-formate lyase-activating enzyme